MSYKRMLQDIKSGKFDFENSLLKRVALQVEKELSDPRSLMNEPHKKLIMYTFDYAQKAMKKEVQELISREGTFCSDLDSEQVMMIIDDISAHCDCSDKAVKLIELFVNDLMTVGEIEMILY